MITDELYDLCLPVLDDKDLEEEDKVERLEDFLKKETSLNGAILENTILDALWKHRNASKPGGGEAPSRHTVIRNSSPAPWQMPRTGTPLSSPPISNSPAPPPGFSSRPSFSRQKPAAPSPFASPRPSPRLALAQPIPHSPNLNAYEFSEAGPTPEIYGDYGSDNVDWLVADDTASNASSTGTGQLSAAAPEWVPQPDMSPHDILRSVLGDRKTNDEIEEALERNSYDLGATIAQLSDGPAIDQAGPPEINHSNGSVLVGKSMTIESARPVTPNTGKSSIVCKYWLASGSCMRADCRFSHDATSHVCKYWLAGNCLAGETCQFSHDPSTLIGNLSVGDTPNVYGTPPHVYQLQDQYDQFPALQSGNRSNSSNFGFPASGQFPTFTPLSQQRSRGGYSHSNSRPQSRPTSRHQQRPDGPVSVPSVDDTDAFPTLASLNAKRASKHHGQRSRHSHNHITEKDMPSSLADLVRMSPSPAPNPRKSEAMKKIRPMASSESAAAQKIPQPQHIPWLETGARANQQYLKHRQEAIKHGSVRNKFLQSAAQAWNRNDARAAKALSLRGQAENDAMRKAHREAARALFDERNSHLSSPHTQSQHHPHIPSDGDSDIDHEFYIDLHGLHPEEAVDYLDSVLNSHAAANTSKPVPSGNRRGKIVYAITGTGHHSKNGKDKVGKAVRAWLAEGSFTYREFSVPGERGGYVGGILGVESMSGSGGMGKGQQNGVGEEVGGLGSGSGSGSGSSGLPVPPVGGKIQVLKREDVLTP